MQRYEELYAMMATSTDIIKMQVFGEAEKWAFGKMSERDPALAQVWLDKLEPVMWNNYLSKAEAEAIVSKFINADGTIGAHWSYDTMRSAVESLGAVMSEEPFFNCWALWATMNMLYSEMTGQPLEVIERDTDRDNYMSAEDAVAYGIVDKVITKR